MNPEAIRMELNRCRNEFGEIPVFGKSRDVCMLEIKWFKNLLFFLEKPGRELPGPIPNHLLMSGNAVKPTLVYHLDYEIAEESVFEFMMSFFHGGPKLVVKYSVNPRTVKPCVILEPIVLKIQAENKGLVTKTVSPEWVLGDLKPHVCRAINVLASNFVFTDRCREKVNENTKIGDYVRVHGEEVRLTKHLRNSHSSLLATLPQTFSNANSNLSSQSKLLSSTLPQRQLSPLPNGLVNLGNTCFLNSAIQCLARLKPLYNYVLSSEFDQDIKFSTPHGAEGQLSIQFKELLEQMTKSGSVINPRGFRNAVIRKHPIFANFSEHDAQEALTAILDGLHEDLKDGDKSFISELFYGQTKSSLLCPLCNVKQEKTENFLTLSLPLVGNDLLSCIKSFCSTEILDTSNMWKCEKCGVPVKASRTTTITKTPKILIIHLNRFDTWHTKDDRYIKYEMSYDFSSIFGEIPLLKLVAVIYHVGEIDSGHYTASVLDQEQSKWYHFNDLTAQQIRPTEVISQGAYILFYQE